MRFLNIYGPGVIPDETFCPNCHVLLDDRDGYKVCQLYHYDTRQATQQRRVRRQRRLGWMTEKARQQK